MKNLMRAIVLMVSVSGLLAGCSTPSSRPTSTAVSMSNAELETMVLLRLSNDPVTSRLQLGVQAEAGVVTLTGRIDQAAMRARTLAVVRGTPGVLNVIDKTFQF